MRRVVLAANAICGAGGQGLNLVHMRAALEHDFDLFVFSRAGAGDRAVAVPAGRAARLIGRVPLLRRRRDWQTALDDMAFDDYVARHLPAADAFVGVVGQCATALRRAGRRGMATVLDVVNTHVDDFREHVERECRTFGAVSFLGETMYRRIREEYDRADLIRVMSRRAKRTFTERGIPDEKVVVATPPVDVASFPRARLEGHPFRIIYVGLLEPWKGVHYLLEAYARLGVPDAELVLWGGSGCRGMSRMIAAHAARDPSIRVRPVPVRQAGLDEVYGQATVLVHPSLAEGLSYSVVEAMACGLPVIVTENTGAADLVDDGVNGFVVRCADPDAILERLELMARERDRLPRMGAAAREAASHLSEAGFRVPLVRGIGALL